MAELLLVNSSFINNVSLGKINNLHLIYLLHLLIEVLDSVGLRFVMQTRPLLVSLVCSSCSSDQDFAVSFLQITSHGGAAHYQTRNGLSLSSCCPCWAHIKRSYILKYSFFHIFKYS